MPGCCSLPAGLHMGRRRRLRTPSERRDATVRANYRDHPSRKPGLGCGRGPRGPPAAAARTHATLRPTRITARTVAAARCARRSAAKSSRGRELPFLGQAGVLDHARPACRDRRPAGDQLRRNRRRGRLAHVDRQRRCRIGERPPVEFELFARAGMRGDERQPPREPAQRSAIARGSPRPRSQRSRRGRPAPRTPAARHASSSSVARPKIDGSPPLSRTTRSPASAASTISASIVVLILRMAPRALADRDQPDVRAAPARARRARPARRGRSRCAARISRSALRVSRSGSPGPAPTSHTVPGAMRSASATCRLLAFRRSGAGSPGGTSRNWCPADSAAPTASTLDQALAADGLDDRLHADVEADADDRPAIGQRRRGAAGQQLDRGRGSPAAELRDQPVAVGQAAAAGDGRAPRCSRPAVEHRHAQAPARADRRSRPARPWAAAPWRARRIAVAGQLDQPALPDADLGAIGAPGSPSGSVRARSGTRASRSPAARPAPGVALKPGWPECGSTSARGSRPVRPPLDWRSVQWIGVKTSPRRWPALSCARNTLSPCGVEHPDEVAHRRCRACRRRAGGSRPSARGDAATASATGRCASSCATDRGSGRC